MLEITENTNRKLAKYATIKELPAIFYGTSERQMRNYVDEMQMDTEFRDATISPTKRTTLVHIERFTEFLKKKEEERFR